MMSSWHGRGTAGVLAVGVATVLALGTGCSLLTDAAAPEESPPPPTSGPATPSVLPSAQGTSGLPTPVARRVFSIPAEDGRAFTHGGPVLVASVYGIYRDGDYARLDLGLTIAGEGSEGRSARPVGLLAAENEAHTESSNDATGLALVDPDAKKAYLVASDAEDECLCSPSPDVAAGMTTLITATFAAPPPDVSVMDVVLPKFGVSPSVPITDGAPPPSINSPAVVPTAPGSLPPVLAEEPVSSGPVAEAPVVDITTPVSNLDESVTEEGSKVVLAADVIFAFDEATLTKKAKSRIAQTAAILRKKARGTVRVNGHTDSKGSAEYNLKLSKRRAEAVRAELAERLRGSGLRLVTKGYGESDPVAPNRVDGQDNPKGRALNRRVETVYEPRDSTPDVPAAPASASPQPGPTGELVLPKAQASKSLEVPGLRGAQVELYEVYRHGRLVTMNFGFTPPEGKGMVLRGLFSEWSQLHRDVTGVSLVDPKNSRRYTPARYGEYCFCSTWLGRYGVSPGQTFYLSATFAAPPADVTSVDVDIPRVGTFTDVSLS